MNRVLTLILMTASFAVILGVVFAPAAGELITKFSLNHEIAKNSVRSRLIGAINEVRKR